jgi:hypothetical protein
MNLLVYAHGYEESFSLGHWNRLLRQVGCRIVDNSAILFMPGMLRTLDVLSFLQNSFGNRPDAAADRSICLSPPQISLDQKAWLPDCEVVDKP